MGNAQSMTSPKKSSNKILCKKEFGKTKIILLSGSLMDEVTDAIVNPANPSLQPLGGVCGKIFATAGSEPFDECQEILSRNQKNFIQTGEAVMTSSGRLAPKIRTIIHAAGPVFEKSNNQEKLAKQLADTYTKSLKLLTFPQKFPEWVSLKLRNIAPMRSIAFPSISTGIFHYPLEQAAPIALAAIKVFIEANPDSLDEVRFVFLPLSEDEQKTSQAYQNALDKLGTK